MRNIAIVIAAASVLTTIALYGAIITAGVPERSLGASSPIDVMRMMQNAKDLPVQQFDPI